MTPGMPWVHPAGADVPEAILCGVAVRSVGSKAPAGRRRRLRRTGRVEPNAVTNFFTTVKIGNGFPSARVILTPPARSSGRKAPVNYPMGLPAEFPQRDSGPFAFTL